MSTYSRYQQAIARGASTERLILFSDAVFAIAMTLLVIELHAPEASEGELGAALVALVRPYLVFALSFAVIGLAWLSHQRKFRVIARADPTILRLNLLMMFFVASVPLPTAILGHHGDSSLAVVLYATTICAVGFALSGIWVYAWHAGLVDPSVDLAVYRYTLVQSFPVPGIFLLSIPIGLAWGATAAEITWVAAVPCSWLIAWSYRRFATATATATDDGARS